MELIGDFAGARCWIRYGRRLGGSEGFEMQEMELVRVTAFEPWSDRVRALSVRNDLRSCPVQIQVRATLSGFGEAQLQLEAVRLC